MTVDNEQKEGATEAAKKALWAIGFTKRELKEIQFCRIYARDFAHGTNGHNERLIIAKMADLLDKLG